MSLVRSAEALLDRSARAFTRAASAPTPTLPGDGAAPPSEAPSGPETAGDDLVRAAVDVGSAHVLHRSGTLLIRLQREQDRALLDVIA